MRRIKKADVKFLSLCKRGMNQMPCLFKSDAGDPGVGTIELACLHKFDQNSGELLFVAYAPELRDAEGDIASAEVIKEMAYTHARNGARLDVRHDLKQLETKDAYVAQSFVIQKGDPRFADWKDTHGKLVDVAGGWGGVVVIENPEIRKEYESGNWNGVSLFGPAQVELNKGDSFAGGLSARLKEGDPVDLEKLAALIAKNNEVLIAGLAKALTPAPVAAPAPLAGPAPHAGEPKFTGDPSSVADLEKHVRAVETHRLMKSGDMNDPAKVAERIAALKKSAVPVEPTADELKKALEAKDAETAELRAKLAKAQGGSNVPDAKGGVALSKAQEKAKAETDAGAALAKELNGHRFPTQATAAR